MEDNELRLGLTPGGGGFIRHTLLNAQNVAGSRSGNEYARNSFYKSDLLKGIRDAFRLCAEKPFCSRF